MNTCIFQTTNEGWKNTRRKGGNGFIFKMKRYKMIKIRLKMEKRVWNTVWIREGDEEDNMKIFSFSIGPPPPGHS